MAVFDKVDPRQNFPHLEDEITKFWRENKIFEKSVDQRPAKDKYVFYDGPPFITGMPHYGHLLGSIAKDVVPRYQTMKGKRVERRWGWDCHGLPIENKVEAKLGLKNRRDIEKLGVEEFIKECYTYTEETSAEWNWYIDKIGRWVDMENSYRTMDQDYMESVIWVFKQIWEKGLIYEGTRVSLFCTRCGTPVSNFEIAMDNSYEDMEDPAVTIKFVVTSKGEFEGASILAWTTTPWTLPSNRGLVVDENADYVIVDITRNVSERKSVTAILVDREKQKAAIIRNKNGQNILPGGGIESGETVENAIKREIEEETGYQDFEIIKKLGTNKYAGSLKNRDILLVDSQYYLLELKSSTKVKPTNPDEPGDQVVWIDLHNLNNSLSFEGPKVFAKTVQSYYQGGVIEERDYTESNFENFKDINKERIILAKARLEAVLDIQNTGIKYEIIKTIKGKDLVGLSYIAPYNYFAPNENDWKVYAYEGMVTMDEGTGIVHSAPGYGEIDTKMGEENGLTLMFAVDDEGNFVPEAKDYAGIYIKKADPMIISDLEDRDILFKAERINHRYPYCYRCKTPLIQKAQPSWYLSISKIRQSMLDSNENINWVPDHLKTGRFKKGIEQAPDWGISRTRYWATPMPIWACTGMKDVENIKIVMIHGNGETTDTTKPRSFFPYLMKEFKKLGIKAQAPFMPEPEIAPEDLWLKHMEEESEVGENTIVIGTSSGAVAAMRYAERHKVKGLILVAACYTDLDDETEKKSGFYDTPWQWDKIKANSEWIIQYHSKDDPFIPVDHAEFISTQLNSDFRLKDNEGHFSSELDGKNTFPEIIEDVKNKLGFTNCDHKEVFGSIEEIEKRSGMKVTNLHRPYIDEIKFDCPKCGGIVKRISEVLDVWLDSGSMPYAQEHYPFENKQEFEANYPADYIVEYIGQTRAWFYVMHAVSNALFGKESFKNVITTGVMAGTDGRKMSKSYGNYPDPKMVLEKYGAEAMRLYFMGSPIMVGENMNVSEEGMKEQLKSFILPLWNSYSYFITYANIHNWTPKPSLVHKKKKIEDNVKSVEGKSIETYWYKVPFGDDLNMLDRWIVARLEQTIRNVTIALDEYNLPAAVREYPEFVQDLSKWYIRRSRNRFIEGDVQALDTLYYVLVEFIKLLAPFAPFITEHIWQNLVATRLDDLEESVHLADFPQDDMEFIEKSQNILHGMQIVREIVTLGQNIRVANGLKVRQPLSEIEIKINAKPGETKELDSWMMDLIKDELNIRQVQEDINLNHGDGWFSAKSTKMDLEVAIDANVTDNLKREGLFREFIRYIQAQRKAQKFDIEAKINIEVITNDTNMLVMLGEFDDQIKNATGTTKIQVTKKDPQNISKINGIEAEIRVMSIEL